jgi:hypothetical protein
MGQTKSQVICDETDNFTIPRKASRISFLTQHRKQFERMPKRLFLLIMSFLPQPLGFYTLISVTKDLRKYLLAHYETNRLIFPLTKPKYLSPKLDLSFVSMISLKYHDPESIRKISLFTNLKSIQIHGIELQNEDLKFYLQQTNEPIKLDSKGIVYVKNWQGYQYGNLSIREMTEWSGEEDGNELKIFMFGIQGVGKGTIFRHIDSMLGNKRNDEMIPMILYNVWKISVEIAEFYFGIVTKKTKTAKQERLQKALRLIKNEFENFCHFLRNGGMTNEVYEAILCIWADAAIRRLYKQIKFDKLTICDGIENLFSLDTLLRLDPNHMCLYEQDILYFKKKATGITKIKFQDQRKRDYIFGYVGGEISERKKWSTLYPSLNRFVYVTSLLDYCRFSPDCKKNRLEEALDAFDESICAETLKQQKFFLVFTKIDAFQECLERHPLKKSYPKYMGESLQDALDFIKNLFVQRTNIKPERFVIHYISSFSSIDVNDLFDSLTYKPRCLSGSSAMEGEDEGTSHDISCTDDVYYF